MQTKTKLSMLKALNPLPSDLDEIQQWGFNTDIGGQSKWITDGHSIFWRAGLDQSMLVNKQEFKGKNPSAESIAKLWDTAKTRDDVSADILGSLDRKYPELDLDLEGEVIPPKEIAILRDQLDRIIYVNAFKLAFMLHVLKPDALSVAREEGDVKFIRFMRGGDIVGCLMPMRSPLEVVPPKSLSDGYNIDGDPLSLETIALSSTQIVRDDA